MNLGSLILVVLSLSLTFSVHGAPTAQERADWSSFFV